MPDVTITIFPSREPEPPATDPPETVIVSFLGLIKTHISKCKYIGK